MRMDLAKKTLGVLTAVMLSTSGFAWLGAGKAGRHIITCSRRYAEAVPDLPRIVFAVSWNFRHLG